MAKRRRLDSGQGLATTSRTGCGDALGGGPGLSAEAAARRREVGGPRDPRHVLSGRPRLSPALHYLLMVGAWADARLHGWVALAMVPPSDTDNHIRAAWADHGEALTTEARSFDFEPYQVTRRKPRGPGFDRWQQTFIAEHRY